MIELYHGLTPNVWKVAIMLEECELAYRIRPVRLAEGEQYEPAFLAVSPNNRIPAIVDHAPANDAPPIAIFESGAILLYLAEKSGRFLPIDPAGRYAAIQWLMWQMSAFGPMLGQHGHFRFYTQEPMPYALDRFRNEAARLYGVLDRQLAATGAFVAGAAYGVADIACFPWAMTHKAQGFTLDDYPHIARWYAVVRARDAVQRGIAAGRDVTPLQQDMDETMRRKFFGIGTGR